jgi:hypothetical protein
MNSFELISLIPEVYGKTNIDCERDKNKNNYIEKIFKAF